MTTAAVDVPLSAAQRGDTSLRLSSGNTPWQVQVRGRCDLARTLEFPVAAHPYANSPPSHSEKREHEQEAAVHDQIISHGAASVVH